MRGVEITPVTIMGRSELDIVRHFGSSLPKEEIIDIEDIDANWMPLAKHYESLGYLNNEIFSVITHLIHWHAIADRRKAYLFFKRIFDFLFSLTMIFLLAPFFVALAIIIKVTSRGPMFFRQIRIGQYCQPFWIYKFRTMHVGASRVLPFMGKEKLEGPRATQAGDPRITWIGSFLRKSSLDELPQLFNVLKGDMSLIGPRPLTPEDSGTTSTEYYIRFAAKPGMSGLWQATFRNTKDGKLKLILDCEYVRRQGFMFDMKLLILTFPAIVQNPPS